MPQRYKETLNPQFLRKPRKQKENHNSRGTRKETNQFQVKVLPRRTRLPRPRAAPTRTSQRPFGSHPGPRAPRRKGLGEAQDHQGRNLKNLKSLNQSWNQGLFDLFDLLTLAVTPFDPFSPKQPCAHRGIECHACLA